MRTQAAQHVIDVASAIVKGAKAGDAVDHWTLAWARFIVRMNAPRVVETRPMVETLVETA